MRTTSTPTRFRAVRRSVVSVALGLSLCGGFAACGASTPADKTSGPTTTTVAKATTTLAASPSTTAASGGGSTDSGGNGQSSGGNGTGSTGTGTGTGTAPATGATTAPIIDDFTIPTNTDCSNVNPTEQPDRVTVSWRTQNTTKVTISIDGPGIWDTYNSNGSTSLPFSCAREKTYLLTAFGTDGHNITKLITLAPQNSGGDMP